MPAIPTKSNSFSEAVAMPVDVAYIVSQRRRFDPFRESKGGSWVVGDRRRGYPKEKKVIHLPKHTRTVPTTSS